MADYYDLTGRKLETHPDALVTAAVLSCGLCGTTIAGMGGPGHGAVCRRCARELIAGRLRGAVVWPTDARGTETDG